jgi:hypothetical protein
MHLVQVDVSGGRICLFVKSSNATIENSIEENVGWPGLIDLKGISNLAPWQKLKLPLDPPNPEFKVCTRRSGCMASDQCPSDAPECQGWRKRWCVARKPLTLLKVLLLGVVTEGGTTSIRTRCAHDVNRSLR